MKIGFWAMKSHGIFIPSMQNSELMQSFYSLPEQNINGFDSPLNLISGSDSKKVAALFRVIGSHRLNHFTIALLHGARVNPRDPKCKLLSLYPVKSARKFVYRGGKLRKCNVGGESQVNFEEGKGCFCRIEFPGTFRSWEEEVRAEKVVKKLIKRSVGKLEYPKYEHNSPLKVLYTKASQSSKLRKVPPGSAIASAEKLPKYHTAAQLDGCLLYFIARSGCKGNVAVILAINDTLEPFGPLLQSLPQSMVKTITKFVMAVVVAGLPKGGSILTKIFFFFFF